MTPQEVGEILPLFSEWTVHSIYPNPEEVLMYVVEYIGDQFETDDVLEAARVYRSTYNAGLQPELYRDDERCDVSWLPFELVGSPELTDEEWYELRSLVPVNDTRIPF